MLVRGVRLWLVSMVVVLSALAGRRGAASLTLRALSKSGRGVSSTADGARCCLKQGVGGPFLPHRKLSARFMASTTSTSNYGANLDQEALMETDQLVAVNQNDKLIPNVELSKRDGHTFDETTPRALLHRAFSFFLFNKDNKLLLTKRAASKITFPNVWTNTVCSHPLYGMTPNEVDVVPDAYPEFPGIKNAAVRKCKHELGIEPEYLPIPDMQFITRFHYWAADTITYGKDAPWGEHEVDYILFFKTDQENVPIVKSDDEVVEYKFVSIEELRSMLKQPDLLWSPWFLGIMERGGWDWWEDLQGSLEGKYTNDKVTFFNPPPEHVASYNLQKHDRRTGVILQSV